MITWRHTFILNMDNFIPRILQEDNNLEVHGNYCLFHGSFCCNIGPELFFKIIRQILIDYPYVDAVMFTSHSDTKLELVGEPQHWRECLNDEDEDFVKLKEELLAKKAPKFIIFQTDNLPSKDSEGADQAEIMDDANLRKQLELQKERETEKMHFKKIAKIIQ